MTIYFFGPFRLDPAKRELCRDGAAVYLAPKAFDTLLCLVERRDRVVSKPELLGAIWPERAVEEANLTQQVSILRKLLSGGQDAENLIATVQRHGYRFVAAVTESAESDPHVLASAPAAPRSRAHLRWISSWWIAVLVGVTLVALGFALSWRAPVAAQPRSLVVLPFASAPEPPGQEYLADGMTEGLINRLSQAPGLAVIARTTAFRYRTRTAEASTVARELGVAWIVTGRTGRQGGQTVLQVELTDARGVQAWGQRYVVDADEVASLVPSVSNALALQLGLASVAPRSGPARHDPEAYQLYLQGRFFWNKRTDDGLRRSLELFRAALARDPDYAEAWSGLADAYALLPEFADWKEKDAYPLAGEAAHKALLLDPSLAEAQTSLAFVHFWWERDRAQAEQDFRRALNLNPGYATAHHWYGNALLAMGRTAEALAQLEEAQRADPLSLIVGTELGAALYLARRYDDAALRLQTTLELDERFHSAHFWAGRTALFRQRPDEALGHFRRARVLLATPAAMLAELGLAEQRAGREPAARDYLRRLLELSGQSDEDPNLAVVWTALGEREQALSALERAAEGRATELSFIGLDPVFDPLRPDPRFAAVLARIARPRAAP